VNAVVRKSQAKTELVEYLYGCCGSPAVSTFIHAIKNGNFLSWPGIESISFTKHLPPNIDSAKGHLDQERKSLQSTKILQDSPEMKQEKADFFPPSDSPNVKTHDAIADIVQFTTKNTAYQDLTRRFPHNLTRGNEYILIVYDHDSNCILHHVLKDRAGMTIKTAAWEEIQLILAKRGCAPNLWIFDNECSKELKQHC